MTVIDPGEIQTLSADATRSQVFGLLGGIDWPNGRVCDVGAGTGTLSRTLIDHVQARGLDPSAHVFACDQDTSLFRCPEIVCHSTLDGGRTPFDEGTFDATVSVEVIEHVEDQFAFLRELVRITRPGGRVIVTTPNVLNMMSRLRTLFVGFPLLFDPLPLSKHDARFLGGHVHPISPYFLAYGALRSGLTDLELVSDRTKRSAAFLTIVLYPFLFAATTYHRARRKHKEPDVHRENRGLSRDLSSWRLMTGRTSVLIGTKPKP